MDTSQNKTVPAVSMWIQEQASVSDVLHKTLSFKMAIITLPSLTTAI